MIREVEYRVAGKLVGVRTFDEDGRPEYEYALKNGKHHGFKYDWHSSGKLSSAEPFVDGVVHGIFKQWDDRGRLLGTYRMDHGTGLDLWRQSRQDDGAPYLSEVVHWKSGQLHGFEWWLEEDQKRVFIERHWHNGELHGIEREWNRARRLSRDYPKYHVTGIKVTRRQYLKAAASDPTLPPFQLPDNKPARKFPPEVSKHLRPKNSKRRAER